MRVKRIIAIVTKSKLKKRIDFFLLNLTSSMFHYLVID